MVVFALFRTSIRSHHHVLYKTRARAVIPSLITFVPHFIHSFIPALALPAKKNYTAQQKHTPALRFQRRLSEPSLQIAHSFLISLFFVQAIPASHLRSTRYRLAPLTTASRESTSLRFAAFPLAFVRLRAALPARFSSSPSHSPRPPTPEKRGSAVILQPYQADFLIPQLMRLIYYVSNIYSAKRNKKRMQK